MAHIIISGDLEDVRIELVNENGICRDMTPENGKEVTLDLDRNRLYTVTIREDMPDMKLRLSPASQPMAMRPALPCAADCPLAYLLADKDNEYPHYACLRQGGRP